MKLETNLCERSRNSDVNQWSNPGMSNDVLSAPGMIARAFHRPIETWKTRQSIVAGFRLTPSLIERTSEMIKHGNSKQNGVCPDTCFYREIESKSVIQIKVVFTPYWKWKQDNQETVNNTCCLPQWHCLRISSVRCDVSDSFDCLIHFLTFLICSRPNILNAGERTWGRQIQIVHHIRKQHW